MPDKSEGTEPTEAQKAAERIVNGPWPITMILQHPVTIGKELITELQFQKGRFEFLKDMDSIVREPTPGQLMQLAANLCERHVKVIWALDPDDVQEVLAHAAGFIARCRAGGPRRSAS